jgi:hypothetical protein
VTKAKMITRRVGEIEITIPENMLESEIRRYS